MDEKLSLLKKDELEHIDRMVGILRSFKEVKCISIVGSLAKGLYSEGSDIDILVLVEMSDFSFEKCRRFVDSIIEGIELKDDAYDIVINGRNYSLLFKDSNSFIASIRAILEGKKLDIVFKPWAFGGMIEDVLLLDIRNQIILEDTSGEMVALTQMLSIGYPPILASLIMEYCEEYLRKRGKAIDRFCNNELMSDILKTELMIGFSRYMYAKKRAFNPGLKHIYSEDNTEFLRSNLPELIEVIQYKNNLHKMWQYIESQLK